MEKKDSFTSGGVTSPKGKAGKLLRYILQNTLSQDTLEKIVSQSISFSKMGEGFPEDLGLKFYIGTVQELISQIEETMIGSDKGLAWKDREERERAILKFEDYVQTFRSMVDRAIEGARPTRKDEKILRNALSKGEFLAVARDDRTEHFHPVIRRRPLQTEDILWLWVYWVWKGEIKVTHCQAEKCGKIFISNPRGPGQKYCSKTCRDRELKRRYRRKKRQLSIR